MARALELASNGWGRVHPNPMVGAVVVRDGAIVGEGWHAEYGGAHAEVTALRAAGDRARGATLYVTLEPCAHHGKTPPCTEAILAAGLTRLVYGSADPDPVASGGAAVLADRGLVVTGGILAQDEGRLNAIFHHRHVAGTPWVAVKLAMSVDGRISREPGRPTTITGPEARAEVHRLRAGFDSIMVGSGTALADDPELTVRGRMAPRVPPVRIVLDSKARIPDGSRLLGDPAGPPVWIFTAAEADDTRRERLRTAGARVFSVPSAPDGLDLDATMQILAEQRIRSILCEGGGRLASSLIESDRVERVYLFVAPRFLGSRGAPAFPIHRETGEWAMVGIERFGPDALLVLDRNRTGD
jgi:diaminohydroxyphosphoribosylaminopyrimidine deaminase / 5-amino-6-(5-phosphoribosylamino)uracil reductase